MRKFLLLAGMLLGASSARAQSQMFVTITTATFCSVSVSTVSPTRVDNFNGGCEGLLPSRTAIKVTNPTGNATINCGFSNQVSSNTTSGRLGEEVTAGSKDEEDLSTIAQYWCIAQSTAASVGSQVIDVKQANPHAVSPVSH